MVALDEDAELAPRDIVARGIFAEVAAGRGAFLDCTKAVGDHFEEEFPTVYGYCKEAGFDPTKDRIPVIPSAHYHMGGILTDADGRSTLDGLWACGETTSTGAHGANRLASNSLLEAVVFAGRIANNISGLMPEPKVNPWKDRSGVNPHAETADDDGSMKKLRSVMSSKVGVLRDAKGMREAVIEIDNLERANKAPRFSNTLTTAKLMTIAGLKREESRGGHFRTDFPEERDEFKKRTFITLKQAEEEISKITGKPAPASDKD